MQDGRDMGIQASMEGELCRARSIRNEQDVKAQDQVKTRNKNKT